MGNNKEHSHLYKEYKQLKYKLNGYLSLIRCLKDYYEPNDICSHDKYLEIKDTSWVIKEISNELRGIKYRIKHSQKRYDYERKNN